MSNVPTGSSNVLATDAYARGGLLIVRKGGTLPQRCLYCNSDSDTATIRISIEESSVDGAALVGGIMGGLIGGLIVGMIRRERDRRPGRVRFDAFVCRKHQADKRRVIRNVIIIIALSVLAGSLAYFLSHSPPSEAISYPFGLCFWASLRR